MIIPLHVYPVRGRVLPRKVSILQKPAAILLLILALLVAWVPLHAQTYSWVQRTGGDPVGNYADGATANFAWAWSPAGQKVTGHYSATRVGSGVTSVNSESASATIVAHGGTPSEFNHSPFAVSVGGVSGIYQFVHGGDTTHPPGSSPPGTSTTMATLTFDPGASSPANALIELFDPGSNVNGVDGPFTCAFTASLNGVAVDTTQWTLDVEYPYSPAASSTTGITWDGHTVTVPHYLDGALSGGNFPDTIVFLNTGATTFDTLTVTAVGLNVDTFGVGLGANSAPVGTVPAGILQFSNAAYSVNENAGAAPVTVRRTSGSTGAVSVSYATADGTASNGTDYSAASGTLSWADGDTADKTFLVPITNQGLNTGNIVSISVALSAPTGGATLGPVSQASVNITQSPVIVPLTVALTSPPDNITLEAGAPLPLGVFVEDPSGTLTQVQFQIDGQAVGPVEDIDSYVYNTAAPTTTGTHQISVVATDNQNRQFTSTQTLTVVPVNVSSPVPRVSVLTDVDGRNLPLGTGLIIDAGGSANGTALQQVNFYSNGVLFASFDGSGDAITSAYPGTGRPTRQEASAPAGVGTVFQASYQMPGSDKVASLIAVALDQLGRSTISKAVSVHAQATNDRPPLVSLNGITTNTHFKVGTTNPVAVTTSDPGAGTSVAVAGVKRDAAPSTGILALMEYFINGVKLGQALTPPFSFSFTPPSAGKYVLDAIATDNSGLASISDPVVVVADAPPATVNIAIDGTGVAVEGGAKAIVLVTRAGDLSGALTVPYAVKGSAKAGVNFKPLSGQVTIQPGAAKAKIKIKPLSGSPDTGTLKIKLVLQPSTDGSYALGISRAKIKVIGQ